ncbi:helix-turn-helix domain-containing protein [Streptomyces turgidiscabies]|uniref:helix-turn-helix domain-containing protein n=1 Tax=Streptomyces turgidiscabies TaxID=85558 RepID=UPI0029BC5B33|nr:helix-turn-helix domain-containing protein [Streptomyces turgidiscabies]MDX3497228.1 helix-turn-helix domain-containing protein [Streptomyces turgidiscabies]
METDDPQPPHDPERVIGREMRRIRERMGLTQLEVAERMLKNGFRFHQTQIAKMERGERPIRVNEWIAIATALGTTVQDMLASEIGASIGESPEKPLSLAELERERDAVHQRLRAAEDELARARTHATATRAARDAAESAARDAEMRLVEAQAHVSEYSAVAEHLDRRIWVARGPERRVQEESELDSVLDDAEQAIAALDGMVAIPVGKRLAAARRQANLSVEDVSTATSLTPVVVRALEEPDYSKLVETGIGGDAEGRREGVERRHTGMMIGITRYAEVVKLDPDPLVKQYQDEMMSRGE